MNISIKLALTNKLIGRFKIVDIIANIHTYKPKNTNVISMPQNIYSLNGG